MPLPLSPCPLQSLEAILGWPLHVLRLDRLHPIVSGNKWFKLRYHLEAAANAGKTEVLTFGGAYSNHLVATAAAARAEGFSSTGIVRGEEKAQRNPTLLQAEAEGMRLRFVPRQAYREKAVLSEWVGSNTYVIPEGGYSDLGAQGAATIASLHDFSAFTHIVTAVGTGTTLAGLARTAGAHQSVIGIPVLKNAYSLRGEIEALLSPRPRRFVLEEGYHFGGYAKAAPALFAYMNDFYRRTLIPTDFVYTAKLFYAVEDLFRNGRFGKEARVLAVHTGGLQGNRSLPKGTLIFEP